MTSAEQSGSVPVMKQEFLERLRAGMLSLPAERIRDIEEDIHRHFDEGMEGGVEEERLSEMLGSPEALAQEYVSIYEEEQRPRPTQEAQRNPAPAARKGRGMMGKIWAAIGMFFVNLCFGIAFWALIGTVWLVLACGYLIAGSGVLAIILSFVNIALPLWWLNNGYPWITVFGSIFCIALGILMIIGLNYYNQFMVSTAKRYLSINRRAIFGGEQS